MHSATVAAASGFVSLGTPSVGWPMLWRFELRRSLMDKRVWSSASILGAMVAVAAAALMGPTPALAAERMVLCEEFTCTS
jgi:hypothetical protein